MNNPPISEISGKTVIVTIHGIGFEQPPHDGKPGYADGLHANLASEFGVHLGGDPQRPHGPVYVLSAKPGTRDREWGLSRLGTFPPGGGNIDITNAPLTANGEKVAHVAVVYVPLEDVGPGVLSGVATLGEAGLRLHKYTSLTGGIRLAVGDVLAALREHAAPGRKAHKGTEDTGTEAEPMPWLRPREDVHHHAPDKKDKKHGYASHPTGLAGVVHTLEDDVVGYVDRNELRERIRQFVHEVLHRLTQRPDVGRVIINAHSQGTVVAFDVLRVYPAKPKTRIDTLITAGSPLRKYADMFSWGNDVGGIQSITWLNFWDSKDPVADPLDPPSGWHFGDPEIREPGELGLMWATDGEGKQIEVPIRDTRVDNVANSSGGGLQAHNYWNNRTEFVPALVKAVNQA